MNEIRKVARKDIEGLKKVLNSIELFPSEMLEDLIAPYFTLPETEEIWFTALRDEQPVSIGYCAPEKLTDRTYNLYAIGVQNSLQNQGIGKEMMLFIEECLQKKGARILIVETSSAPEQEAARAFYFQIGYSREAILRDFWRDGEDKIIFWKKLQ
jgi:ribosomal protein S18 acetylase RimI-like enzyme